MDLLFNILVHAEQFRLVALAAHAEKGGDPDHHQCKRAVPDGDPTDRCDRAMKQVQDRGKWRDGRNQRRDAGMGHPRCDKHRHHVQSGNGKPQGQPPIDGETPGDEGERNAQSGIVRPMDRRRRGRGRCCGHRLKRDGWLLDLNRSKAYASTIQWWLACHSEMRRDP